MLKRWNFSNLSIYSLTETKVLMNDSEHHEEQIDTLIWSLYFISRLSPLPGQAQHHDFLMQSILISHCYLDTGHRTCTLGMSKDQVKYWPSIFLFYPFISRGFRMARRTPKTFIVLLSSRSEAAWLVTSIMCCTTLFHRRSILVQNYATLQHDKNIIFEIILYCAGICSTNCQSLLQLSSWDTCWPCLVSRTSSHSYKLSHHFPSCRVSSC